MSRRAAADKLLEIAGELKRPTAAVETPVDAIAFAKHHKRRIACVVCRIVDAGYIATGCQSSAMFADEQTFRVHWHAIRVTTGIPDITTEFDADTPPEKKLRTFPGGKITIERTESELVLWYREQALAWAALLERLAESILRINASERPEENALDDGSHGNALPRQLREIVLEIKTKNPAFGKVRIRKEIETHHKDLLRTLGRDAPSESAIQRLIKAVQKK